MNNQIKSIIYILLAILIIGCDRREEKKLSSSVQPNKDQIASNKNEVKIEKNANSIKNATNNLRRIQISNIKTSFIGTTEQPTIDGGMINDTNDIISSDIPHKIDTLYEEIPMADEGLSTVHLVDDWKKSNIIKQMLKDTSKKEKLSYVISESSKKGLPSSVAIVPIVESNYEDRAISPKGAGGSWQIMPELAKDYNLKENERFDFRKSTEVALNHLKQLHNQFGNWDLTFAAYNAGSSRVENALRDNPNAQSIDELRLPRETKEYVLKIKSINQSLSEL